MNKKLIVIFACTLLIITALQTLGTMNTNIIPNDPDFSKQWHLENTGQNGGTIDADIDAPEAWEIEKGDPNVIIAIVDSGIDFTHPDLVDKLWVNEDEIPDNGIDDDGNGYIDDYHGFNFFDNNNDITDYHGHGTFVSGIAGAAVNNSIGVAGVACNCKLMIIKISNHNFVTTIDIITEGIHYAIDNGAKVISYSGGAYKDDLTSIEFEQANETVDYAYNNGCITVAAAGNGNTDTPLYPAAFEKVIGVAGTDANDSRMYTREGYASNYGEWVDVAAPGYLIYTTAPTYDTDYHNIDYGQRIGTSFATPIVSGIAALLLSRDPTLSPDEVRNLICENVDPYYSEYDLGSGRVNAYKALSALNTPPNKPNIDGPTSGKSGEEQVFNISATDPYEDNIYYIIDWGDDSEEVTIGPIPSGEVQTVSHIWNEEGDYTIKVKAKDILNAEGEWGTLEVSMPKIKIYNPMITLFLKLLERFPFMEKILNQIL